MTATLIKDRPVPAPSAGEPSTSGLRILARPEDVHCVIYHLVTLACYVIAFWLYLNPAVAGVTGPWSFRTGHLFLAPGDSPIGLRLPLDALPWIPPELLPQPVELDPLAPRSPLPNT